MNALLDIIIIAIIVITIAVSVKNGFVRTLFSTVAVVLAIMLTMAFYGPVREMVGDTSAADSAKEYIHETIKAIMTAEKTDDASEVIDTDEFSELLDRVGADEGELKALVSQWEKEGKGDITDRIVNYVSEPVSEIIISAVSGVLLFVLLLILLQIIAFVLDRICRLPGLRALNKTAGLFLGVVLGLFRAWVFVLIVRLVVPCAVAFDITWLSWIDVDKTFLFRIFYHFNIFSLL